MRYLISAEGIDVGLLPPQQFAQYLEQMVIPSHEALTKLEAEKKILAGGVLVGARGGVALVEAESNEEVDRLLMSLPFWSMVKWTVTPLNSFRSRATQLREALERSKAALQ